MQYWDEVLYPSFLATIRGTFYSVITQDELDEECYYLACRAISAFKFPRITTEYTSFYAIRVQDGNEEYLEEVDPEEYPNAVLHGRFLNDLSPAEIEILIAWMKVYWAENHLSNADNFDDLYTDANIKTYSRANAVDKNTKLLETYRTYAKDLEQRYSRVRDYRPTIGEINSDE